MLVTLKNVFSSTSHKKKMLSSIIKVSKSNYSEITFETKPCKLHKLETGPSTKVSLNKDEAITLYTQMNTIRRMETAAGGLYKEKIIRGFCHLYSGQEACCVGIKAAMRDVDSIITAYRDHGWAYIMGVPVLNVMCELTGRRLGCSRGKGGSMHMYNEKFFGGNGIVGAQVPVGAGVALAYKYMNTDGVCIALYGDGAANQGQVFEVYNMSALWKLPVIYVCENNGYGMGTSSARASACPTYYTRGDYIPGISVDGMDVLAVKEATRFAIDHCVSGKGPIVMEVMTYRYSGHSMSDPGTSYRTREEVQEVRQTRDPVTSFKDKIINVGFVTPDELKVSIRNLEKLHKVYLIQQCENSSVSKMITRAAYFFQKIDLEIRQIVDDAVKKSKVEKEVEAEELVADIYTEPIDTRIRGVTVFDNHLHIRLGKAINSK